MLPRVFSNNIKAIKDKSIPAKFIEQSYQRASKSSKKQTYKIVLVRHGESEWNACNMFTGWYDSVLSEKGRCEAWRAAKAVKQEKFKFDLCFTSVLTRAIETLDIILEHSGQKNCPVCKTWRLNERHYGALTGKNKTEAARDYGAEQIYKWRRSYAACPPRMDENHPYYDCIINDSRYTQGPDECDFPMFESLELTINRTLPFWHKQIVPEIYAGRTILVCAHGNSLRGIIKYLDCISDTEICNLNVPLGIPFCYELDESMRPIPGGSMRFMGNPEVVRKAKNTAALDSCSFPC